MKIYLAGPMTGYAHFNFPAFHAAAARLRASGHFVFSPAEQVNQNLGKDVSAGNLTGDVEQATKEHGFDPRKTMARDMAFILLEADAIALLPGWENSKGAKLEHDGADYVKIEKIFL